MSRSYWIAAIALGLSISFSSLAEEITSEPPIEQIEGQQEAEKPDPSTPIVTAPEALLVAPTKPAANEHNQSFTPDYINSTDDHLLWGDGFAQWVMAGTGVGALILSGVAVWLLWSTLTATRTAVELTAKSTKAAYVAANAAQDAAESTERIGEAQVRAYISITDATFKVHAIDEALSAVVPEIGFNVNNVGNSPAKDFKWQAEFFYFATTIKTGLRGHRLIAPSSTGNSIATGAMIAQDRQFLSAKLSDEELGHLFENSTDVFVTIFTAITDVFNRTIKDEWHFVARIGGEDLLSSTTSLNQTTMSAADIARIHAMIVEEKNNKSD